VCGLIFIKDVDYSIIKDKFENAKIIKVSRRPDTYSLVTSFDIETTSTIVQGEKVAFMYIWQFAFEDYIIYGRTWEQYKAFTMKLQELGQLSKERVLITYIHNMSFEFQFMRKYFDWINIFAVDERKPIKALTEQGIQYKDSYILSGYSLSSVANNLQKHTIKKLVGFLDYEKVRTYETTMTNKELEYCAYDVIIIVDYIHEQIDDYGDITKIPLTNTGRVRKFVRDACYFTSKNHRKSSGSKYQNYREIMSNLTLDSNTYLRLKKAFQGGYTHANANKMGQVINNVGSVDFTSSYPAVMVSEMFPMSKPFKPDIKTMKDLKHYAQDYNLLIDMKFTNIQSKIDFENYLSESKCKTENAIVNNGRIYSADTLITTITEIDLSIIEQVYSWDKIEIGTVQAFYKNYLPKPIIESIIKLYKDKTTLKNVESKRVEYMRSKGMLNSMYGMTVTDIVQINHKYENSKWFDEISDIDEDIQKYNTSKSRFLYYPWGVWITAYARRNLWTGIIASGDDYCYSDTDSIKIENFESHKPYIEKYNNLITSKIKAMCSYHSLNYDDFNPLTIKGVRKPLGVWDFEGVYDQFKTLGAKRYLYTKHDKFQLTLAGLSKSNGINYMLKQCHGNTKQVFEMFNDELYIPAEETGKNTHTYIDDTNEFQVTDFQGHKTHVITRSGIHLSKADFTLSVSKEYGKFLYNLRTGILYLGEGQTL